MADLIRNYMNFLDTGKTERRCVDEIIRQASEAGYRNIDDVKTLKAGDKVWVNKMGKSVVLFEIGTDPIENGMNILGGHIDSPRLDIKQNPLYERDGIVYLNTHYYGGIKKYQWLTLPLALYGVVFKADGTKVDIAIGDDPEDPVFSISDILPHIDQARMQKPAGDFVDAENLDLVLGAYPVNPDEKEAGKKKVLAFLNEKYGIEEEDFISAELEVVPAGKARFCGFNQTLILSYGQDDRICSYTSFAAMLETPAGKRTNCGIFADKEEIGSAGATGMNSHLLDNAVAEVVARLGQYSELTVRRALCNSWMLSSDVNSAYDPLPPNNLLYDKQNSSFLSRGVVFNKYTGSRGKSGASDANAEFISKVRNQLNANKVTFQTAEMAKVGVGGGGTIAHYCAEYGMSVLDCGVPILSMHAPWEIASTFDIQQAFEAYKAFLQLA